MGVFKVAGFSVMTLLSLVVIALGVYYAVKAGTTSGGEYDYYLRTAIITLSVGGIAFLVFYKLI